jgi:hypothetical protein
MPAEHYHSGSNPDLGFKRKFLSIDDLFIGGDGGSYLHATISLQNK